MKRTIRSTPEHGVGNQELTFRMAANAIWNKLNFALSLTGNPKYKKQLEQNLIEARALADSIVKHENSGDE